MLILITILAMWQFLAEIRALRDLSVVFDPFFVSSPSRISERLGELVLGNEGRPTVWPYLWQTMQGTLLGVTAGIVGGAFMGLICSNSVTLQQLTRPYLNLLNATPRIALIPVIVIIAGPTLTATALTAVTVVFFLVFYAAFAGGSSVPKQMVQNARLLGATRGEVMHTIRLPYVLAWTFTTLPNAVSLGLIAVVTAEVLTGKVGMGRLLLDSISFADSTGTFAVVVVLAVVGVSLVTLAGLVERRVLHWWEVS